MKIFFSILRLFACLLFSTLSYGQSKEVWLNDADKFYTQEDFASALKFYNLVVNDSVAMSENVMPYETILTNQKLKNKSRKKDSSFVASKASYVLHQIAMCYANTFDYPMAEKKFIESMKTGEFPEDIYHLGIALKNNKKHEEAIETFDEYIRSPSKTEDLLKKSQSAIKGCHQALNPSNVKKEVEITLADTSVFNKGTSSFSVMYWEHENKVLFSSARAGGVVFDPIKQDSRFLSDLYWTESDDGEIWKPSHNFGRPLNSGINEAAGCFNNGNAIFYTRWSNESGKIPKIYLARMVGMRFFESFALDSMVNMEGFKSMHPFVSADGSTLYFSSNRPGGQGGMDIWKVKIDENGNPKSELKNLGNSVNSAADEVTPFFHETTSTLFFSSNGFNSIGGQDIFKSSFDRDAAFYQYPVNMGEPYNSTYDDTYMIWDKFLKKGFLSSDREDCENGHCYNIYTVTNAPIRISIEGFVFDDETEDPIENATVILKDVFYKVEPIVVQTDEDGFYETPLPQDIELFMKATKQGYFADAASVDTKGVTQTHVFTQDFYLGKIPVGEIELGGIEYDYDSHKLRDKSLPILDTLAELLTLNDNLIVQINSHTDSRGNDDYNMSLSERRAKSCVDYLILKGIPKDRLKSKGFGETTPALLLDSSRNVVLDEEGIKIQLTETYINTNSSKTLQEKLHQRNRRTAFLVLGEGFKLGTKGAE